MAGPAIRAWNIADAAGPGARRPAVRRCTVRDHVTALRGRGRLRCTGRSTMNAHVNWADVIIFQGYALNLFPALPADEQGHRLRPVRPDAPRAAGAGAGPRARAVAAGGQHGHGGAERQQLRRGDFFLCANETAAALLARTAGRAGPDQPLTTTIGDETSRQPARPRPVRPADGEAAGAEPARDQGRRRPGSVADDKVVIWARRRLQLVRPGDAGQGDRRARCAVARTSGCSSSA